MSNIYFPASPGIEGGFEVQQTPRQGFQTTRTFEGTQSFIEAKEALLTAAGWSTTVTQGAVWKLRATIGVDARTSDTPGVENPVDTWELLPNVVEKDILEADSPAIQILDAADKFFLRDVLDGKINARDWDYSDTAHTPTFADVTGNSDDLYKLIVAGVKSKPVYQPILRHTRTVSAAYQITSSLTGVGLVYSSAKLVELESPPNSIAANFQTSGNNTRDDGIELYKGWLKTHPTVNVAAYSKSQIVQEWQWGEWATTIYQVQS